MRREFEVPDGFDPKVLDEAERAATSPTVPDLDWTDVELVTSTRRGRSTSTRPCTCSEHGEQGCEFARAANDAASLTDGAQGA